jgi:hypothetical protein
MAIGGADLRTQRTTGVFGTINIDTRHRLFLARKRQRGEDFRTFLPVVASPYSDYQVTLLLDEDSSHTAR